jgi:hypothetical protein
MVPPVIVAGIGDVEVTHEFAKVALGCLDEQMEVVIHENVAVKLDTIYGKRLKEDLEEAFPVVVVSEDFAPFIATARNVIHRAVILNPQGSGHGKP